MRAMSAACCWTASGLDQAYRVAASYTLSSSLSTYCGVVTTWHHRDVKACTCVVSVVSVANTRRYPQFSRCTREKLPSDVEKPPDSRPAPAVPMTMCTVPVPCTPHQRDDGPHNKHSIHLSGTHCGTPCRSALSALCDA